MLDAAGVGAYELHDYVEFSSWFRSTLLPVRSSCRAILCIVCFFSPPR